MKKESQTEKFKPWFLSHVCTSVQSQHAVCVNVRLSVSKSYRNGQQQTFQSNVEEVWGELFSYLTSTSEEIYWQLKGLCDLQHFMLVTQCVCPIQRFSRQQRYGLFANRQQSSKTCTSLAKYNTTLPHQDTITTEMVTGCFVNT